MRYPFDTEIGICDFCHGESSRGHTCRACRIGAGGVWLVAAVFAAVALLGVLP